MPRFGVNTFAAAVNRWLPDQTTRVFWIDCYSAAFPSITSLFLAARLGLGETRPIQEAPGHVFSAYPWAEEDQLAISHEHACEAGILIGLMLLLIANEWDGWLVSSASADRVEFWEGNILFYSESKERLAGATALLQQLGCPTEMA
jgi:hypothetical protein